MSKKPRAYLSEIFSSIQGEGLYVGARQVFLRFAGCNLSCSYCDTPASQSSRPEACGVQDRPESLEMTSVANPLDVETVAAHVTRMESAAPGHHSISLTGGEPLMQAGFLRELCPELRRLETLIFLESNGTLVKAIEDLLPNMDIVAMDYKLESAAGVKPDADLHRNFLRVAAGKEVFVKAVVDASTRDEEIEECAGVVAVVDRHIPLVIQPVTPVAGKPATPPSGLRLAQLQRLASRFVGDVRVIPQCHKLLGLP